MSEKIRIFKITNNKLKKTANKIHDFIKKKQSNHDKKEFFITTKGVVQCMYVCPVSVFQEYHSLYHK